MYEKVGSPKQMIWWDGELWVVGDRASNPLQDDAIYGRVVGAIFAEQAPPAAPGRQRYVLGPTDLRILDVPMPVAPPPTAAVGEPVTPDECAVDLEEANDTPQRIGRVVASRQAELEGRVARVRLAPVAAAGAAAISIQAAAIEVRTKEILQPALGQWAADQISTEELEAIKAAAPKQAAEELLRQGADSESDDRLDALDVAVELYETAVREREAREAAVTPPPAAWEALDVAIADEEAAEGALSAVLSALEAAPSPSSGATTQATEQEAGAPVTLLWL